MKELSVLLVDDEEEFITTLAERLNLRGIKARIATEGESALSLLETDLPEVVVLDVMMPGIGGIETLQQIRSRYPQIPVILLTGHGSTKDGIEGMRFGAFDYLMKPLDIGELIKKMEEAVKGL